VVVNCVVDANQLEALLHKHNQSAWVSRKRISGLLLLIDFIIRKGGKTLKISSELSHEFVGRLKGIRKVEAQPLALLVILRILEIVRPAKAGPHFKVSTEYRILQNPSKTFKTEILISPHQKSKMDNAENRNEKRKDRKHPFYARLRADMERLGISVSGKAKALDMMITHDKRPSVIRSIDFLNQARDCAVRVDGSGTVNTFLNSIPKELKPLLEIDGKPVAKCDIEGAHFCILQRVVRDRINYLRKHDMRIDRQELLDSEIGNFAQLIESGDIYKRGLHSITDDERKATKLRMLSALNMKTSLAIHVIEYKWLRTTFPMTFGVVEDIKKRDHRTLSLLLRNYTARIINQAMLQLQAMQIPAYPDTDALIVMRQHGPVARKIIERFLHEIAGSGKVSLT